MTAKSDRFCLREADARVSERAPEADQTGSFHSIYGGLDVRFETDRTPNGVRRRLKKCRLDTDPPVLPHAKP